MDIAIPTHFKDLDFVVHVTGMDYTPAERATHNYPGCPAEVYANEGYVELDGEVTDIVDITSADMDVLVQLVNDNAQLFDDIVNANDVTVTQALFAYREDRYNRNKA